MLRGASGWQTSWRCDVYKFLNHPGQMLSDPYKTSRGGKRDVAGYKIQSKRSLSTNFARRTTSVGELEALFIGTGW
uniref:Uncharacterized protein n=1 Tax=Peronospora matthiolae TaxID=2874970 RepID=A0AAV1T7X6_9STRA